MVFELDEICGADPECENQPDNGGPPDLKPEYCQYKDEGCRYAPSCLACPFSKCLLEIPRGSRRRKTHARNREIRRLYDSGKSMKYLTRRFKLHRRTVERIIRKVKRSNDE